MFYILVHFLPKISHFALEIGYFGLAKACMYKEVTQKLHHFRNFKISYFLNSVTFFSLKLAIIY